MNGMADSAIPFMPTKVVTGILADCSERQLLGTNAVENFQPESVDNGKEQRALNSLREAAKA